MRLWLRYVTIILGLSLILACASPAVAQGKILFISSYHPAFPTFSKQIKGLHSALDEADILLDIEFMDSKRFTGPEWTERFRRMLAAKLESVGPYQVIITADDNALRFVEENREALFPKTPVVFFGVNNQPFAHKISASSGYTGVIEASSMQATLKLIWDILPDTKTLQIIVDSTPSGQGDLQELRSVMTLFPKRMFSIQSLADMTWAQLGKRLRALQANDAILLLSAYRDVAMKTKSFDASLDFIMGNAKGPVFHLWEHGLGQGIVGGKVVSHIEQGRLAGLIALDIINGESPNDIPVMSGEEANRYIVDYAALKRWGIDEDRLPARTQILNKPVSPFKRYRTEIIFIAICAVLLASLSGTLFIIALRLNHSRMELLDSNSKLNVMFSETPLGMILFDPHGTILDCNDVFVQLMGSTKEALIGFNTAMQSTRKMREAIGRAMQGEKSAYRGRYTSLTGQKTTFLNIRFTPVIREGVLVNIIATLEDLGDTLPPEKTTLAD